MLYFLSARQEALERAKRNNLRRSESNRGKAISPNESRDLRRLAEYLEGAPIRHSKSRIRAMPSTTLWL